jgi:hypothetical protein
MKLLSATAILALLVATAACAAFGPAAPTGEFHVSPAGRDSNPGTVKKPFATLAKAQAAVRAFKSGQADKPVTVWLHGGTYQPEQTLEFRATDSGTAAGPIRWCAVPGETPVVSGARAIKGWKPLTEPTAGLAAGVQGKVWVADIPKVWRFHALFVNGERMQRAQMSSEHWRKWPWLAGFNGPEVAGHLTTFKDKNLLSNLPSNGDVEVVMMQAQYGVMGNFVMTDVQPDKGTARLHSKQLGLFGGARHFNIENALPFLDTPGEWCVDSTAGKVYLWPTDGSMDSKAATAPKLYELIRLQGDEEKKQLVRHLEFSGITFACTDRLPENEWPHEWLKRQWEHIDATIYVQGAEDCAFTGNRILHSGSSGITLDHHAQRIRVEGNEIGWPGSDGVFLCGYGPGTLDVNKCNIVRRNWIHDMGQSNYWHSAGIQNYQSGHNQIALNLIERSAYCGISIVGASPGQIGHPQWAISNTSKGQFDWWNLYNVRLQDFPADIQAEIRAGKSHGFDRETAKPYFHSNGNIYENNIVIEPEMLLDEGGAIYAWCPGKGNVWKDNIIFKSSGLPGSSIIALDDLAEYFTITGNVIWVEGRAACGTIGVRASERGNIIHDNIRAAFKPEYADGGGGNLNGIAKGYYATDTTREPVYQLLKTIAEKAGQEGGWLGNPKPGIPAAGEPVKPVDKRVKVKMEHVTIE